MKMNPDSIFRMWLQRIVDTHRAQAWNLPQTEQDEEESERFNELWQEMGAKYQHRLWGLSADLCSLRDNETFADADWCRLRSRNGSASNRRHFNSKTGTGCWTVFVALPGFVRGKTLIMHGVALGWQWGTPRSHCCSSTTRHD